MGDRGFHHEKGARQIDVDDLLPLFDGKVGNRAGGVDARVVDQDIDFTAEFYGRVHHCLRVFQF